MKSQEIDFGEFQYWKSEEIDQKAMRNWEMVMKNRKKKSLNIEYIIRSHNKCILLNIF